MHHDNEELQPPDQLQKCKAGRGSRQAARVLCALMLGAYLTAGYSMPVAWGEEDQVRGNVTLGGSKSSAWGLGTATGWVTVRT